MYISQVPIDPDEKLAREMLEDPALANRIVGNAVGGPEKCLWRLDGVSLDVVSVGPVDVLKLAEKLSGGLDGGFCRSYVPFLDRLAVGQRWRFRITGNPVRVANDSGARKPIRDEQGQAEWLMSRAERLGFRLVPKADGSVHLKVPAAETVKVTAGGGTPFSLLTVVFNGELEVADVANLRAALTAGVGRGRAYGCGLLQLLGPAAAEEDEKAAARLRAAGWLVLPPRDLCMRDLYAMLDTAARLEEEVTVPLDAASLVAIQAQAAIFGNPEDRKENAG